MMLYRGKSGYAASLLVSLGLVLNMQGSEKEIGQGNAQSLRGTVPGQM